MLCPSMNKLQAHLATGRISNLPTVWSNVLVSISLVITVQAEAFWPHMLWLCLAASLLYVGGCYLGDARDLEFDREHKPDRPIPSGLISAGTIWTLGAWMMLAGVAIPIWLAQPHTAQALGAVAPLFVVITIYALFHKRSPWLGLPLIGACRGFLILFATNTTASAFRWSSANSLPMVFFALAIAAYTICFASVARLESTDKNITWKRTLMRTMILLPLAATPFLPYGPGLDMTPTITFVAAYILYFGWLQLAFRSIDKNKGAYVSKCLAGFALLDACLISPASWQLSTTCVVLFLFAWLLQKIAPAT